MSDERSFLAGILQSDKSFDYDGWRKVYADWCEERGEISKAIFLRTDDPKVQHEEAANLDPNWLAVVSNPHIENCGRFDPKEQQSSEAWWRMAHDSHHEATLEEWQKNNPRFRFDFICTKKWQDMMPTEKDSVRHCEECKENVYFCDNIIDARIHGGNGHCVAIDLGVIRRENDTSGEIAFFGRPSQKDLDEEQDRRKPDAVSAKRLKEKGERTFLYLFDDHRGQRAYLIHKESKTEWNKELWEELELNYPDDLLEFRFNAIVRPILAREDVPHPQDFDVKPFPDENITVAEWLEGE